MGRQYERATSDDEHNYRLIESIERNALHYIDIFSRAVDKCLPQPTKELKCDFHRSIGWTRG